METKEKHPLLKELEISSEVEISVEQRHIDQGQKNVRLVKYSAPNFDYGNSCAIYLSIEEYFGKVQMVGYDSIEFLDGTKIDIPPEADVFIRKHDSLRPVKPFKFKIKL